MAEPAEQPESSADASEDSSEVTDPDTEQSSVAMSVSDAKPAEAPVPASIPAPTAPPARARGFDGLALGAMITFVLVGGLLVFGFAQAIVPAAESQLGAACRPLSPEPLAGAAPSLELEDLEGNPVSLEDYAGKFLVVNFWATWCEPCTREWPDLDTLAARMSAREDIAVLAISIDQQASDIGPYLQRMGLTDTAVTVLWAKDETAHQSFGSDKIPDTYFVDRSGQLESVFINVREWGQAKGVRCVEASADYK